MVSGVLFFFFQAEDGIRDGTVTGVQTCALPILRQQPAAVGSLQRHAPEFIALHAFDAVKFGEPSIDETVVRIQKVEHAAVLPQDRSEEHTSELQSQFHLVCRLLLEKKKTIRASR